jgi:hypothetical protein
MTSPIHAAASCHRDADVSRRIRATSDPVGRRARRRDALAALGARVVDEHGREEP